MRFQNCKVLPLYILIFLFIIQFASIKSAEAATIMVDTPDDQFDTEPDVECSLREAVQAANINEIL